MDQGGSADGILRERLMGDETDDGISFPSSYEGDARSRVPLYMYYIGRGLDVKLFALVDLIELNLLLKVTKDEGNDDVEVSCV
ncbi:hypothetical protein Tco_0724120 [Tanacetum coccineum]